MPQIEEPDLKKSQSKLAKKEEKQARKQSRLEAKHVGNGDRRSQRGVVRERAMLDRGAAIQRLEELLAALKLGTVSFEQSSRYITLEVSEPVDLRLRACRKPKSESLTIRMRWKSAALLDASAPVASSESPATADSSDGTPSAQE